MYRLVLMVSMRVHRQADIQRAMAVPSEIPRYHIDPLPEEEEEKERKYNQKIAIKTLFPSFTFKKKIK